MNHKNWHINFKALMFKTQSTCLNSFNVDVYKNETTLKVVYSVLDSSTANYMFNIFLAYNDTAGVPARFFLNIDSMATNQNLYKKDSIELLTKNNIEYLRILDSCFMPGIHQFDRQLPEDVINIGGVPYRFAIEKDNTLFKKISIISPTNSSYPFLTRFIKRTFDFYQLKNTGLLNRRNTNGRYSR